MQTPIFFISDIHLMLNRSPGNTERENQLLAFLDFVKAEGGTLFINGDLFDFYFEYRDVIPKVYFPLYHRLFDLKTAGVEVHYLVGNHDYWIQDFISGTLMTKAYLDDVSVEIDQKKFYITHGDGYLSWDRGYRVLKAVIRNPLFIWLYRWVHPRIGYAFARWISKKGEHYEHSDEYNLKIQNEMQIHAQEKIDNGYDYFITGHYHQAREVPVNGGKMLILGDWLNYFSYGYFDGEDLTLKFWGNHET